MARFLHIADVHLGFDRYDNKQRTQDFFYAFRDVLSKYAIDEQVDFVIIAGDLFEHRNIQPATLNQAQGCLDMLREAGIPVLAIEGNHDNRPYGTKTSWLRYLADWGLLKLLEPGNVSEGEPLYSPWSEVDRRGGYIDLECGVRVLGSVWYGASAPRAIEQIAAAIPSLPPAAGPTILLFHHGVEGQIARYQGALRYSELLPLKQAGVDYLALGHIHKSYEVEGWIFNPGSTEANSIEEASFTRGAYLIEITESGIQADLKQNYYQRAIVRLMMTACGEESVEEIEQQAIERVQQAIQQGVINTQQQPIVELRIEGHVGFDRMELDVRQLQQQLHELSHALIFLLKFNAESNTFVSPVADDANRLQIEQDVFLDLLTANATYKKRAMPLAQGLIDLKEQQLNGRSDLELYEFVQTLLNTETEA
ncbi:metallophosphoesterase family protein [Thermocoleostomius sinensis]|uniref:Nuclease SbcCD subunit D n=1 Tax=Thermocoleostomius sinensis A174 TaxID=2016057 RepID=A0A9E9C7R6_9CYAN|nr:DNA repair exonuclease [Thermocoleostomius sinensis]WAL59508.1 DNA repair exonuclease [Thermocoleostomius sinensis A174]